MKIKTLIENTAGRPGLKAEAGLSMYIETERHKILFDTGMTGDFVDNAREMGVDLEQVDLVVGMSPNHILQLQMMYPGCKTPMISLDDPPVSDPYGGDDAAYERAAQDIERQLPQLLNRI